MSEIIQMKAENIYQREGILTDLNLENEEIEKNTCLQMRIKLV